ncbi:hypothetical protein, partial [Saccharibacter floricola]|uniref:hypothetical protein n=1 Tax=Saccharibacter floricola TaxID=231053 RepID=UPI00222ED0F0
MTIKPFLIITLLCSSSLLNTHPAHAQGVATYDNAPIPSDGSPYNNGSGNVTNGAGINVGSISQNGNVTNGAGINVGSISQNGNVTNGAGINVGSISQDGNVTNGAGINVGHTPNRALGALMLLNVI